MKQSIHCLMKDFFFFFLVISVLATIPLLIHHLFFKLTVNKLTDIRFIAKVAILAIILSYFSIKHYLKQIFEYITGKPRIIEKAIVGQYVKRKEHKHLRFRDITWLTVSGQKGVYCYYGQFDYQVYDYFCRISILPNTHVICGIEQTSEALPEKRKIRRINI